MWLIQGRQEKGTVKYDIIITVTVTDDRVEVTIRQGRHGEPFRYYGSSLKDAPENVAGALEDFLIEMGTRITKRREWPKGIRDALTDS